MADDYYGDDINDDYFDDNENNYSQQVCHVYDAEDSFTSFVQIMLAVLSLASLHVKRNQEVPRRKFETWFLDVSKQGVGAVYAHFLNMAIAKIIAQNVRGDITLDDECAWYAINYLIDTTIGLVLSIMFLQLLDIVADQLDWAHLKNKGVYVGKDRYTTWAVQLVVWIIILTIVKLLICWFMWLTSEWLAWFGKVLFEPFQKNIRFELLFVMIFFLFQRPSSILILYNMNFSIISLVALVSPANAFAPSTGGFIVARSTELGLKTGAAGRPAKSKEEDLELTTQVILDYVNSQDSQDGIEDDEEE